MANVTIDSGPITIYTRPDDIPVSKWHELVSIRRYFIFTTIPNDCRALVKFHRDASKMWQTLGYKSPDDLIRDGYGIEPHLVRVAVSWLNEFEPDRPVRLADIPGLGEHGEYGRGRPMEDRDNNVISIQGNSQAYTLARLKRDRPDLVELVLAGELSANAAAIQAGFRRRTLQVDADDLDRAIAKIERHYKVSIKVL